MLFDPTFKGTRESLGKMLFDVLRLKGLQQNIIQWYMRAKAKCYSMLRRRVPGQVYFSGWRVPWEYVI